MVKRAATSPTIASITLEDLFVAYSLLGLTGTKYEPAEAFVAQHRLPMPPVVVIGLWNDAIRCISEDGELVIIHSLEIYADGNVAISACHATLNDQTSAPRPSVN